ncbi:hypothetical protein GPECTOR_21g662 [Gonium pectorale]|uniref:Uncharacterized protein n=1 Tax=Gonium pectorale TaxID=33097 RepID=A0A150GHX4_GONPE|nr:hypothetical protein GPECTOR_21g662 [Gonium pectorale]|eukprot:KXZ49436.1 hypothetical protein GPECTOR_21g662 [Gonium pectorale]
MASALSQHEELSRVLGRYEELLAAAESVAPTRPRNASAVAAAHAALAAGPDGEAHGQHPQAAQQELPAGQKVSQTAAAVAAALKEKVTGAFDKLMAAASAARAPAAAAGPGGATAPDAYGGAYGGVHMGGPLAPVQESGEGTFTLLDDEDDEANEGTSLITKRAAGAVAAAPPPSYVPPSYYGAPQEQQWQQQPQQQWAPAAAEPPQPAAPAPPAAADLICLDDEEPVVAPQVPGTAVPAAEAAASGAAPMQVAIPDPAPEPELPSLLSGLDLHAPTPSTAVAESTPSPAAAAADEAGEAESAKLAPAPLALPTQGSVSRGGSNGDQLVEALDRLVAQESVSGTPVAAAAAEHPQDAH